MADARDVALIEGMTEVMLEHIEPLRDAWRSVEERQALLGEALQALAEPAPAVDLGPFEEAIRAVSEQVSLLASEQVERGQGVDGVLETTARRLGALDDRLDELRAALDAARPALDAEAQVQLRALQETAQEIRLDMAERVASLQTSVIEVQRMLAELDVPVGAPGPPGPEGTLAQALPYEPGRIYRAGEAVVCHADHPDRWAMAVAEVETYEPPGEECPDWRVLALHGLDGAPGVPGDVGPAGPGFTFRGVYRDGIYAPGDVVIAPSGSLFVCEQRRVFTDCPQEGWRLFLKVGKRGPSGRPGVGIAAVDLVDGTLSVELSDQTRRSFPLWPAGASPMLYRGEYDDALQYGAGDVVGHAGTAFLSTTATRGAPPPGHAWLPLGSGRA